MYMWTHNDTCVSALCLLCYALFSQLVPMPHTTPHTIVMQSWATTHWSLRNGAPSGSSGRRLTKSAALLRGGVAPSSRISFSRSMGWIMFYLFITFYILFIIFYHLFSSCFSYSRTELVPLRNVCIPCIWVCILSAALIASSPRFCSSSNCSWLGMTALARILTMQVICFPRRPLTSDKQRHKDSFALLLSHSSAEKGVPLGWLCNPHIFSLQEEHGKCVVQIWQRALRIDYQPKPRSFGSS